jgi:hypothetical protein
MALHTYCFQLNLSSLKPLESPHWHTSKVHKLKQGITGGTFPAHTLSHLFLKPLQRSHLTLPGTRVQTGKSAEHKVVSRLSHKPLEFSYPT